MAVNFRCRRCGFGIWHREDAAAMLVCSKCNEQHDVDPKRGTNDAGELTRCFVCDCDRLYRQRDFNRKMGVLVVVVAAVFAPFTWYLSLVVAAIIDLVLWFSVGEIALCYHCESIHRDVPMHESIEPYDLATHERYENRDWGHLAES